MARQVDSRSSWVLRWGPCAAGDGGLGLRLGIGLKKRLTPGEQHPYFAPRLCATPGLLAGGRPQGDPRRTHQPDCRENRPGARGSRMGGEHKSRSIHGARQAITTLARGKPHPKPMLALGLMRAFCHGFWVQMLISFVSRRVFHADGHCFALARVEKPPGHKPTTTQGENEKWFSCVCLSAAAFSGPAGCS